MKQYWNAAFVAAGLILSTAALAQAPPMPGGPPMGGDPTMAPAPDAGATYDAGYTYQTTGWDPTLLLYASGGLALGSVALKGALRKRA